MNFDNDLVVGKLRRWEKFLAAYRLPDWDAIPDFGLYMTLGSKGHLFEQFSGEKMRKI